MTKTDIVVTYYYVLKDATLNRTIEKQATADKVEEIKGEEVPVLTTKDGEVTYNISYNIQVNDYKGRVSAQLTDYLPYAIDEEKSSLNGGTYDKEANTITWNVERQVDTFANGMYSETIEKQITIVYVDQDLTKPIENKAEGILTIYYPDIHVLKPAEERLEKQVEAQAQVIQDYEIDKTVEKVWDDNNDVKGRRPESVTVQLTADGKTTYNGKELEKVVLSKENNWTYTFKDIPRYKDDGKEITYSVVETETNKGDLEYYEEAKVEELENVIRVTNKYKLMNINLESSLEKTGTKIVTSSKQDVKYSLVYNATVTNYIGEALVTIVDYLPYEIDEEKSKLNGGIYDKESNTITWTEKIDHINTYEDGDYKVQVTKDFTVVYSNLDATNRSMENKATATIDLYETETTNTQETSYKTNIKVPGKVVVKYINKENGEELAESYTIEGLVGETYTAKEKDIYGCSYVGNTGNTSGTITEDTIEVTYYYIRINAGGVVVRYVDEEGNSIADPVIISGKVGDPYKTTQKDIENYEFIRIDGQPEGELTKDKIEVTYIYSKIPAKVIVQYLEKDNTSNDNTDNKVLAEESVITGFSGDRYTVERKEIENYMLTAPEPTNSKGIMTKEDIYVVYYYERMPSGTITVKYVDVDTNKEILHKDEQTGEYITYADKLQGLCGLPYETSYKEIPYYNFIEEKMPENASGLYTKEDIEIIYYYSKQKVNLKVEQEISKITVNGQEHSLKEDLNQIDIVSSKVNNTNVEVTYKVTVINTEEIKATALVIDQIPEFLVVTAGTSSEWYTENGKLQAEVTLEPGETKELIVVLKWKKNANNFGLQTNIVTLKDVETPANFEETTLEDNTVQVDMIISVKTGAIDISITLELRLLAILGTLLGTIIILKKKQKLN